MGINSCRKGKRGEREWAAELAAHGYAARRGQQFSGSPDSPDVVCDALPRIHFEVKRVQSLNIEKAIDRAVIDAGANKTPVVAHRKNGRGWLVTMEASDWFKMLRGELPVVSAIQYPHHD
jgi:Holliday junction resolvase